MQNQLTERWDVGEVNVYARIIEEDRKVSVYMRIWKLVVEPIGMSKSFAPQLLGQA